MNYQSVLEERNLQIQDLPKSIQKKIKDMEKFNSEVEEINSGEIDDEDKIKIDKIHESIAELDAYVSKKIKIFDPEKYENKLNVIAQLEQKKKDIAAAKELEARQENKSIVLDEVEKVEVAEKEVKEERQQYQSPVLDDGEQAEQVELNEEVPVSILDNGIDEPDFDVINGNEAVVENIEPAVENNELEHQAELSLNDKLDALSRSIHVDTNVELSEEEPNIQRQAILAEEPIYTEVEDEFERAGSTQPNKMSKGLVLMGIGAFLLTWGAVNFFKGRR